VIKFAYYQPSQSTTFTAHFVYQRPQQLLESNLRAVFPNI